MVSSYQSVVLALWLDSTVAACWGMRRVPTKLSTDVEVPAQVAQQTVLKLLYHSAGLCRAKVPGRFRVLFVSVSKGLNSFQVSS